MSWRSALAALSSLAGLVGCDADPEIGAPARVPLEDVEYRLGWTDTTLGDDGEWSVVDERGYEIVVEQGLAMPYAASLVSCADAGIDVDGEAGDFEAQALWSWLRIENVAWAGHGDAWDPSVVFGEQAEDLVAVTPMELGGRSLEGTHYCQVHYLLGPGLVDPDGESEVSLLLAGRYRAPEGSEWHAFEARTAEATGALFDLEPTGHGQVRVELVRDRVRLFDGIAVDEFDADALGLALMRNLARTARVQTSAID